MKSLLLVIALLGAMSSFAQSPKTIEYRKSFDEVGRLSFANKMGFASFEIVKEKVFPLGGEYICHTTLAPKGTQKVSVNGLEFTLKKVVTISPYTYCKKLPDFASITDETRTDKAAQSIIMNYVDESEDITIKLYGNKRVEIRDSKRKTLSKGKVTEVFK